MISENKQFKHKRQVAIVLIILLFIGSTAYELMKPWAYMWVRCGGHSPIESGLFPQHLYSGPQTYLLPSDFQYSKSNGSLLTKFYCTEKEAQADGRVHVTY